MAEELCDMEGCVPWRGVFDALWSRGCPRASAVWRDVWGALGCTGVHGIAMWQCCVGCPRAVPGVLGAQMSVLCGGAWGCCGLQH